MAEENQETTRGPKEVTTKDPKKVEQGKRMQEHNRRKKERELKAKKREEQIQYVIEVVLAVGVIGVLVITFTKPRKVSSLLNNHNLLRNHAPSSKWTKSLVL